MARVRIPLNRVKAAHMPPACIICGEQVDAHVARTFVWRPSVLSVGFWLSLIVCLPVGLVLLVIGFMNTRRATVECPVCERHRGYWAWRGFVTFAPLFGITVADITVGILLVTKAIPEHYFAHLFLGTGALLLAWGAVATIIQRSSLRAVEITDDDIILTPVHTLFADLLRFERQRERSAPDFGWEEYDPYPRQPVKNPK